VSNKDKEKWDKKFSSLPELLSPRPPSKMVEKFYSKSPNKEALDVACGGGRHTLFLSQHGYFVDGIDISSVALKELEKKVDKEKVTLIEADLDSFTLTKEYGFIVMSNFLDRDLIKKLQNFLVKDGIFVVETYMDDEENQKRDYNSDFLLRKGELLKMFEGFEVLEYIEFWNESYEKFRMKKQAIVVKKC
jgi:SAM-dependent methyltransferase